jgi:hypothetical protein
MKQHPLFTQQASLYQENQAIGGIVILAMSPIKLCTFLDFNLNQKLAIMVVQMKRIIQEF